MRMQRQRRRASELTLGASLYSLEEHTPSLPRKTLLRRWFLFPMRQQFRRVLGGCCYTRSFADCMSVYSHAPCHANMKISPLHGLDQIFIKVENHVGTPMSSPLCLECISINFSDKHMQTHVLRDTLHDDRLVVPATKIRCDIIGHPNFHLLNVPQVYSFT